MQAGMASAASESEKRKGVSPIIKVRVWVPQEGHRVMGPAGAAEVLRARAAAVCACACVAPPSRALVAQLHTCAHRGLLGPSEAWRR